VFLLLTYTIEFMPIEYHFTVPFLFLFSEPLFVICLTFWYQFIDKSWYLVQLILLVMMVLLTIYYILFVPESPKWLYTWRRFTQSKSVLASMARFNGVEDS